MDTHRRCRLRCPLSIPSTSQSLSARHIMAPSEYDCRHTPKSLRARPVCYTGPAQTLPLAVKMVTEFTSILILPTSARHTPATHLHQRHQRKMTTIVAYQSALYYLKNQSLLLSEARGAMHLRHPSLSPTSLRRNWSIRLDEALCING
jgi:hypothetical protein